MTTTRSGDAPRSHLRGVYALVEPERGEPVAFTEALLRGGIRLVQIRAKRGIDGTTLLAIVGRVRAAGGLVLVNDDVRLARLADGVHLGQEDAAQLDLAALRRALGSAVIGLSCGTPQEARAADPALIDYVAAGPVFATASKDDAGLADRARRRACRRRRDPAAVRGDRRDSAPRRSRAFAKPARRWPPSSRHSSATTSKRPPAIS